MGQLILRFWDVEKGNIKIGNKDVRTIETKELMEKIAFVFQDTHIFSDTVKNNISMNNSASDEEIIEAAKKARCHEFIMNLPKGYDTVIGSGNIKLSGGEAQRISIARTFLKDSKIVILDEALAYTDAENENLIQEAIKNLIKDKTVIVIAHRLKSIMEADNIIVLKEGKIIEEGTHEQLLEKDGEYKSLWDLQFEAESWEIERKAGER
ncbi:ABC transporter ATP-binding protein [Filifactor alocis]|uniref:ABC transporter ATP-binding protein n=1 Tax=Filifactor alocis TaxID=143361 RepID=UPI0028D3F67F|nr:ATP-binding cassette domain-containing protein [Filifactor alocis]